MLGLSTNSDYVLMNCGNFKSQFYGNFFNISKGHSGTIHRKSQRFFYFMNLIFQQHDELLDCYKFLTTF